LRSQEHAGSSPAPGTISLFINFLESIKTLYK